MSNAQRVRTPVLVSNSWRDAGGTITAGNWGVFSAAHTDLFASRPELSSRIQAAEHSWRSAFGIPCSLFGAFAVPALWTTRYRYVPWLLSAAVAASQIVVALRMPEVPPLMAARSLRVVLPMPEAPLMMARPLRVALPLRVARPVWGEPRMSVAPRVARARGAIWLWTLGPGHWVMEAISSLENQGERRPPLALEAALRSVVMRMTCRP